MSGYILAIDQGTTSSRAILFDRVRRQVAFSQKEITQFFPASGLIEHDPIEIWSSVVDTARDAIAKANIRPEEIAGIGIANQRETLVVWDRLTGAPIHRAIVWQDRRTAAMCETLQSQGVAPYVEEVTGLLLDPYFSATKVAWLLDNVPDARERAEAGRLLLGTIDSYLIWMLTGGAEHATDVTNACRTSLFNIVKNCWDPELLSLFRVPEVMLPEVRDCAASFGSTRTDILGASIPICGVAGDQQAATIGQQCLKPGMIKATYGTGCFVLLNTGHELVRSKSRMLSTIAYRINGEITYALEGSIFIAGAAVRWLRDSLKFIETSAQAGELASSAGGGQDVVLVPAFAGLGAPYWNPHARGAIFGLTGATGPAELTRATLQSVCFQTRDLLNAMADDYGFDLEANGVRVDGGMSVSDWTMQGLSDCLGCRVDRAANSETTALGVASLAGMQAGVWPDIFYGAPGWTADRTFEPTMAEEKRRAQYERWKWAVRSTLQFAHHPPSEVVSCNQVQGFP